MPRPRNKSRHTYRYSGYTYRPDETSKTALFFSFLACVSFFILIFALMTCLPEVLGPDRSIDYGLAWMWIGFAIALFLIMLFLAIEMSQ